MGAANRRVSLALLIAAALAAAAPAGAQQVFPTPEAAVAALVGKLSPVDETGLSTVLGPSYRQLMPLDPVSSEDLEGFLAAWTKGHRVERDAGGARLVLSDGWTLPIPIVRRGEGWVFDAARGVEEIRLRRIGRNELMAIAALRGFLDAQREYASEDRNADGVLEYARRFASRPGQRDGLYWPTADDEPESPAGPLFETEGLEDGYHGYRFRILEAQGAAADGGARSYLSGGRLVNGFAAVAWPARYGETGVMTFAINHDGVVHQSDLGPDTAAVASAMAAYDPDARWVAPPTP
ncbi:MAG: DUF2950 domain-containing protein [Gammaproteobacteria bacterium]|nr:DUF2950 domain-containing protein [Gammaproteobacteria bacterium]